MIERLVELRRVGLMRNALPAALDVSKVTLIYGENGRGKTMFSTVFSSIGKNDPVRLMERQTIGEPNPPEIRFLVDEEILRFDGARWSESDRPIAVFDSRFVDENVYSGFEVQSDQRKQLLDVVLGDRGVDLAKKVDNIAEEIKPISRELTGADRALKLSAGPYSVDDFIAIPIDEVAAQADHRIASGKLKVANNASEILGLGEISEIAYTTFERGDIETLLKAEIDGLAADAADKFRTHIAAHSGEHLEEWIAEGFSHLAGDDCPFCGQDLAGAAGLIDAYKTQFSEEYTSHIEALRTAQTELDLRTGNEAVAKFQLTDATNKAAVTKLDSATGQTSPQLDVAALVAAATKFHQHAHALISKKLADPLTSSVSDSELITMNVLADSLDQEIDEYNVTVRRLEEARAAAREMATSSDLDAAKAKLVETEAALDRHKPEIVELCDNRKALADEKSDLEVEKRSARDALDEYTPTAIATYETALNGYLEALGAEFRVVQSDTNMSGGVPRMTYQLELRGTCVSVSQNGSEPLAKTFANTLSEGDKRTLALAFFLARSATDPELAETILVIDDPVSSFDSRRKHSTQMALVDLAERSRQLVVLSHDARFLDELSQKTGSAGLETGALEIKRFEEGLSQLVPCELSEHFGSSYASRYKQLVQFSDSNKGNRLDVVGAIRPLVETNLEHRFLGSIRSTDSLGQMIGKISVAADGTALAQLKPSLGALNSINQFAIAWEHGAEGGPDLNALGDDELRSQVDAAIRLVRAAPAA